MSSIPISLLRYLFVCRVTASIARVHGNPAVALSRILGETIADRLPTVDARPWHKSMAAWETCRAEKSNGKRMVYMGRHRYVDVPTDPWPIAAALCFYPAKKSFGEGEPVLWELKLMGTSADHGHFLEVILPAVEDIGYRLNPELAGSNSLWGSFELKGVYVAHGTRWAPLVENGQLDLRYRPTPTQWSDGWARRFDPARGFTCLEWLKPFSLKVLVGEHRRMIKVPSVRNILNAWVERMAVLLAGRNAPPEAFWDLMSEAEADALRAAFVQADTIPMSRYDFRSVPAPWPGKWVGRQTFTLPIGGELIPYLALAAMFHVGEYTHYGCGTFLLSEKSRNR